MINTLFSQAPGTVSIDFRDAGNLTAIALSSTDNVGGQVEVSFNSTPSYTTNDTTGVIAAIVLQAGGTPQQLVIPMSEPVDVGERLFLHNQAANTARAIVITDSKGPRPPGRRR
jgi:hypothetical protein